MNKLSKEKRERLMLIAITTFVLLATLYFMVLGGQKTKLALLESQISSTSDKVDKAERLVRSADSIESNLAESRKAIDARQKDMAPAGHYYWFLKLLDTFRAEEGLPTSFIVDITQADITEANLLPNFPYKAAVFGVRLNGRFHDVGRFLADLENKYPYFRVQNVQLQPEAMTQPGSNAINNQKLSVTIRVVALLKPGTT